MSALAWRYVSAVPAGIMASSSGSAIASQCEPASHPVAAIATATGVAGVGIVRVSGPEAIAIATASFLSAIPIAGIVGTEMMPEADQSYTSIRLTMPVGSSLEYADERVRRVEEALDAATAGDLGPFHRLLEAVRAPYEQRPEFADLADPAPAGSPAHVTFCGT